MIIHKHTIGLPDLSAMSMHPAPGQVADALEHAIRSNNEQEYARLNKGQQTFLSSWILTLAGYMTGVAEEKRRINGEIPVRTIPPASSQVRTGHIEERLYKALFSGRLKPHEVRSIASPDEVIFTAHPNFAEQRELVAIGQKCVDEFINTDADLLADIARGGYKAEKTVERLMAGTQLGQLMSQALKHLEPRKSRTRADELYEATVDFVPRVLQSGIEEVAVMLRRAKNIDGKMVPDKLTTDQLDCLSAATSTHGSWFTDGDGKRTSRAWDNEFAIVAIKRKAMEEQLGYLKTVIGEIPGGKGPAGLLKKKAIELEHALQEDLRIFAEIEEAAKKRMLALTALQTAHEQSPTLTREDKVLFPPLREAALAASSQYRALITEHGKTLTEDDSQKVLEFAKELKAMEAAGQLSFQKYKSRFDKTASLSTLDALYLVARKGDFPIKLERRENANQYKEVIRHFLDFSEVRTALLKYKTNGAPLDREIYDAARGKNDHALQKVLETMSAILNEEKDKPQGKQKFTTMFRTALRNAYINNARLIEPQNAHEKAPPPERRPVASELPIEKALLLDDISNLWISTLYPNAFKRTIIAEAATPDLDTLKGFGSKSGNAAIRDEVLLRGTSDILVVDILRRLTGSGVEETALYEDPHAILHTPALLAQTLQNPVYHSALGIDMGRAQERVMYKLSDTGTPEAMTAYDFMRQRGFDDRAMQANRLDIDRLKRAWVYVGPAKQLANSDSAKRGTLATSTLNDVTIRECYVAAGQHMVSDGQREYMYVNPTYLGQGGALGRTTGVTLFSPIYTEQGSHPYYKTGLYSAVEKVNRMLGRLSEAYNHEYGLGLTHEGLERVAQETMPLGNPHGLRNVGIRSEKEMAMKAVEARIHTTRDDRLFGEDKGDGSHVPTRYEAMQARYGTLGMSNYSARPASKSSTDDFINTRAIGLNAKEFGIWSVIFGMSEMFEFDGKGSLQNVNKLARYYLQDQTGQHNFTAAIFTLNMFAETIESKWRQGLITMERGARGVFLTKGDKKVSLKELEGAYQEGKDTHKGFDAVDMAFAHVHYQAEQLLSGLDQIKRSIAEGRSGKTYKPVLPSRQPLDPMSLVPESLKSTVMAYRQRVAQIAGVIEEISAIPKENRRPEESMSLKMALDAHHVLLEAGPPAISAIELTKARSTQTATR